MKIEGKELSELLDISAVAAACFIALFTGMSVLAIPLAGLVVLVATLIGLSVDPLAVVLVSYFVIMLAVIFVKDR